MKVIKCKKCGMTLWLKADSKKKCHIPKRCSFCGEYYILMNKRMKEQVTQ